MGVIYLLLVIAAIGAIAFLLATYVPMHPAIKTVLIVAAVIVIIWSAIGRPGDIQVPHL